MERWNKKTNRRGRREGAKFAKENIEDNIYT